MVCYLESQVERARGCVSRMCCHGVIGPESGRGGTLRGSCLTGNEVFPRFARGLLAGSRARRHGTRPGTMDSLGGDAHSPEPRKRGLDVKKLHTTHSTPSLWKSRGKSCGRLTSSAKTRGPHFHDPLARCSLGLPSFLLLKNDRVGLVATNNYSIFSFLLAVRH